MTAANPIIQSNVTFTLSHRTTRGGRNLIYRLAVIQQPEQARACGAGFKAQADRRPIDPPPVCELRIFEGVLDGSDPKDSKTVRDITFEYSANFFLFATLEHARAMAHGRVQNTSATTPPVLTGMPVSGMAYLDRPHEAGYFLFPDLSIRHEGRYRLMFNLYEQTKHEADFDAEVDDAASVTGIIFQEGSFDHRMEIKSAAFSVYSAKKFPGLKESTALSKMVADQGCRVRIRREVRMRKREDKLCDDGPEEYALPAGVRASATPDRFRARSMSNSSDRSVAPTPYSADGQRRSSGQDYPMTHGYLQFGSNKSSGQFMQPSFPASQQQQQHQQQQHQHQQQQQQHQHHPHQHHLHQHAPQPLSQTAAPPRHNIQPAPISPAPPSPFERHSQPSPYAPPAQPAPYHAPSPSPAPYHGYSNRPVTQAYTPSRTMTPSHDGYDRRPSMHSYAAAPSPSSYGVPMEHDGLGAQRPSVSYAPPQQHSQPQTQPQPQPQSLAYVQPQLPPQRQQYPSQQSHMLPPTTSFDTSQQQYGSRQHTTQQPLPPISSLQGYSSYPHAPPRPSTPASGPASSLKSIYRFNNVQGNIEASDPDAIEAPKPPSPSRAGSKRKLSNVFVPGDDDSLHNSKRQHDSHHSTRPNWHQTVNDTAGSMPPGRPDRPILPCPKSSRRTDRFEYPMNYLNASGSLVRKTGVTYIG